MTSLFMGLSTRPAFPLAWRARVVRPEWFGRRCRIVIHPGSRSGSRLIEFDNGDRVVTLGAYLKRSTMDTIDLRAGYRIEVTPVILPPGQFGAQLYQRRDTTHPGNYRWKRLGPVVLADDPEKAAADLATALNTGQLHGVEAIGGPVADTTEAAA